MALGVFNRTRTFILVWPGDEEVAPQYGGEKILIPAREDVAIAYDEKDPSTKGSRYRYGCAFLNGKPLAGTVIIHDVNVRNPTTGGTVKAFDAEEWCKGLEQNNKSLFARGFNVVLDPADVAEAMEVGRPKWERAQEIAWEQEVRDELARQKNFKEKNGQPAPQSSSHESVKRAIAGLEKIRRTRRDAISEDELVSALGGPSVAAKPAQKLVGPERHDDEVDLAQAARSLKKAAADAGINLLKTELEGLLDQDPGIMEQVSQKLEKAGVAVAV